VQATFVREDLKLTKAVVIDDNETFGDAFAAAFKTEFTHLGGTISASYTTTIDTADFTSVLAEIRAIKPQPQIVEYAGFDPAASLLLKQMGAAGMTEKYITDSSQYGSVFTSGAGSAGVGAYMTNLPVSHTHATPLYKYLAKEMEARYHTGVIDISANAFDAVIAAWKTAELAHSIAPEMLIKYMHKTSFEGATGKVSFLPDGDRAQLSYTVVEVTPTAGYKTVYQYAKTLS
jgi:branched-chain amino acid transport system substrate-binding protein